MRERQGLYWERGGKQSARKMCLYKFKQFFAEWTLALAGLGKELSKIGVGKQKNVGRIVNFALPENTEEQKKRNR